MGNKHSNAKARRAPMTATEHKDVAAAVEVLRAHADHLGLWESAFDEIHKRVKGAKQRSLAELVGLLHLSEGIQGPSRQDRDRVTLNTLYSNLRAIECQLAVLERALEDAVDDEDARTQLVVTTSCLQADAGEVAAHIELLAYDMKETPEYKASKAALDGGEERAA